MSAHTTSDDRSSVREPAPDASAEQLLRAFHDLSPGHPLGDRLRERITRHYEPVLNRIARHYGGRGEPVEDLRQTAHVGLAKAIRGYAPDRGKAFISYLLPTVTGEIKRHFRDSTWAVHVPRDTQARRQRLNHIRQELEQRLARVPTVGEIAGAMELTVREVETVMLASESYNASSFEAHGEDVPPSLEARMGVEDGNLELVVHRESLRAACACLEHRQRLILKRRFFDDWTQARIAEEVGCSQMHVSRLLTASLQALHAVMADPP